ncbi:MAG: DUF692 family protein [Chloroflexota bacterium]|nr:DUF692 family protein [Chloroflexota bacterium]
MDFTLNYSPQAAALVRDGTITIDRFKCPPWRDLVAEARPFAPVYIHFDLKAGNGSLSEKGVDWDAIERWLIETDTPYVNVHLVAPADPHTSDERAVARMIADVSAAVARFGAERIICENIPFRGANPDEGGGKYHRACIDPANIRRVLDETGASFLFDLSHARITAESIGMDARAYMLSLPLDRLSELHVTGLGLVDGMMSDHMPLNGDDWMWFDWVIGMIGGGALREPWCAAFEYGGITPKFDWRSDPAVIGTQVPRMVAASRDATSRRATIPR